MKEKLLITNCDIVTPFEEIKDGEVLIQGDRILEIGPSGSFSERRAVIDTGGRILAPGFIDLHIQGAGGYDVLDGEVLGLKTISKTCTRFGVTGFLATTVFRPDNSNEHLKVASECTGKNLEGADLLGIHLEGPFIATEKRGMIRSDCISEPSKRVLGEILDITEGSLSLMTIAPELSGSLEIIMRLKEKNIVSSFGHSLANYEQTVRGIEAGISHVTHLFNAMQPIHHRNPGPLPAIFENDKVITQVIFDGVHIHPSLLRFTKKILGDRRIVLITDGMQAMGLSDGYYEYNGLRYESKNGTARYMNGTLIGTSLGMNRLVERFVTFTGSSLLKAVRCASFNPASVLGIENRKGSIEKGKDADIVIMNRDLSVWKTIKDGKVIYEEQK